jgi:hypothetical protein
MNRNAMLMVAILLTIAIADYSYEKKIKTRSLLFTCNYNIRLHLQAKNTKYFKKLTFSFTMIIQDFKALLEKWR